MRFKVANYSRLEIRLDTLHIYNCTLTIYALWGIIFIRETGLAKIYPHTKFEVSSSTHSKFTEGVLKLKNSADGQPHPIWGIFCRP